MTENLYDREDFASGETYQSPDTRADLGAVDAQNEYDADNVIAMTRENLRKHDVTVDEVMENFDRAGDDHDVLRRIVESRLALKKEGNVLGEILKQSDEGTADNADLSSSTERTSLTSDQLRIKEKLRASYVEEVGEDNPYVPTLDEIASWFTPEIIAAVDKLIDPVISLVEDDNVSVVDGCLKMPDNLERMSYEEQMVQVSKEGLGLLTQSQYEEFNYDGRYDVGNGTVLYSGDSQYATIGYSAGGEVRYNEGVPKDQKMWFGPRRAVLVRKPE